MTAKYPRFVHPLRIKRIGNHEYPQPSYGSRGAACFDLRAVSEISRDRNLDEHAIPRGALYITYGTGFAFEVPDGHVMLVYPRSSTGIKKHATLPNSVGVIDSDYRGEVMVCLDLTKSGDWRPEPGDRIAQAMIVPIDRWTIMEVPDLSSTDRGTGGIGSTGEK